MRNILFLVTFFSAVSAVCQETQDKAKYQVCTVTAVKPQAGDQQSSRYEISLKAGETIYVVIYAPPNQAPMNYLVGHPIMCAVEKQSINFRDPMGRLTTLPILRQTPASAPSKP
jgi:hypothetical protein